MGMGIAQMALLAGADDAGSTMMEENVVSASGTTKLSATEYELQLSITRAGFKPVRRNSDYVRLETPNALENAPHVACEPPSQIVELVQKTTHISATMFRPPLLVSPVGLYS